MSAPGPVSTWRLDSPLIASTSVGVKVRQPTSTSPCSRASFSAEDLSKYCTITPPLAGGSPHQVGFGVRTTCWPGVYFSAM